MRCNIYIEALLDGEQAWTSTIREATKDQFSCFFIKFINGL